MPLANPLRMLRYVVAFLIAVGCCVANDSAANDAVPSIIVDSWQEQWAREASETVDMVVDDFRGKLGALDESKKTQFLDDMRSTLLSKVSWDALGKKELPRLILNSCAPETIADYEKLANDPTTFESLSEETQERLFRCSEGIMYGISTLPASGVLVAGADGLPSLFAKYGIDPASLD